MTARLLKDPATVNSRIFIGHLQTEDMNKLELEEHFQKYGNIVGSLINRGFAFVQFEDDMAAANAIKSENGAMFKGRRIDVRPAKKDTQGGGGPGGQTGGAATENPGNFSGKPGGPNNSFTPGNNKFSGGNNQFVPGNNQFSGGNDSFGGGTPNQGGGTSNFGGGNKNFGNRSGPNESFGAGNQNRGGGPPNRGPVPNEQFGGPNQVRPSGPGDQFAGNNNTNRGGGNQNQFGGDGNQAAPEQFGGGNQNQNTGNNNRGPGNESFPGGIQNRPGGNNQFGPGNQNQPGGNNQFGPGNQNQPMAVGNQNQGGGGGGRPRGNRGGKNRNKNRDGAGGNNFRDRSPINRGNHNDDKMGRDWERKSGGNRGSGGGYGRDSFGDVGNRGYGRDSFSDIGSRNFDDLKSPLATSRDANSSFGSMSGPSDYSSGPQEKNDCEIIVVSKALTEYAEVIEMRLKKMGLTVDLLFPNEEVPLSRVLGNIASRGCLYAVVVTHVNQEHRSLTLNILHGLPQEHRNMPVEDAIALINRDFTNYRAGSSRSVPINAPLTMDRHPDAVQVLLNMLADNRRLTVLQYDRVIKYLEVKREEQVQIELGDGQDAAATTPLTSDPKQAELQSRILNILNSSKPVPAVVPLPSPVPVPAPTSVPSTTWSAAQPTTGAPATSATSSSSVTPSPLLNDPTVQKALDSLLQGNLLKNIGESQPAAAPPLFAAFPNIGRF